MRYLPPQQKITETGALKTCIENNHLFIVYTCEVLHFPSTSATSLGAPPGILWFPRNLPDAPRAVIDSWRYITGISSKFQSGYSNWSMEYICDDLPHIVTLVTLCYVK